MGTTTSEPCIYDKLAESIDILRQSGQRYGMSEREIERFIKQVLETNEPRREPPQFPILRATIKVRPVDKPLPFQPDAALSAPVLSAVCGGGGVPAGHGAGLHLPPELSPAGAGRLGPLQLVIAAEPRPPSVAADCQEVQPARCEAVCSSWGRSHTHPVHGTVSAPGFHEWWGAGSAGRTLVNCSVCAQIYSVLEVPQSLRAAASVPRGAQLLLLKVSPPPPDRVRDPPRVLEKLPDNDTQTAAFVPGVWPFWCRWWFVRYRFSYRRLQGGETLAVQRQQLEELYSAHAGSLSILMEADGAGVHHRHQAFPAGPANFTLLW